MATAPLDRFRLDGKTVAITGASSGLGHHFAGVLAAAGARVVLGARRTEKIDARVASFLDAAWDAFGSLDVLVNNAGIEPGPKTYAMIDEDDWDSVLDTNLKSVWLGSKLYTERAAARKIGGNIINIASITAYRTIKGQFPYAVSK